MDRVVHRAYRAELDSARSAIAGRRHEDAFRHLERAHVLAQRDTWEHVGVHWLMMRLGASLGDWREVAGQALRIVAAAVFSRIWVPLGNTGRANVGAMKPMPLPDDLRAVLEAPAWADDLAMLGSSMSDTHHGRKAA